MVKPKNREEEGINIPFPQGELLLQSYSEQCCQRRVNEKSIGTVIVAAVCVLYKHSGSGGVGGKACAQMNSDVNGMVKLEIFPLGAQRGQVPLLLHYFMMSLAQSHK